MSSPFDTFRTHKNYWMAGMVLLAILAFIVAPALDGVMGYMRGGSGAGNVVLVRWSDGKITEQTAQYVRQQHARTVRFLQALAREVVSKGGVPKVPGFSYDATKKRVEDIGLPMINTNRDVCTTLIIAERAKQLGIEFDKPVIDDFFRRFCDRKVSPARFDELLKENGGRELPQTELYRQLSIELAAVVMERTALAGVNYEGMPLVTPGSLWQNYLRLNQSARVEAYPILTREYVKDVKETPSDAEIRAMYEAGTENFPSPNSPEPGFRRRYQANIEFVSGSWNKMIESEKDNISEETLKAEYDRLIALGGLQVPVDPPTTPNPPAAPATDSSPAPATTTPENPAAETPASETPPSKTPAEVDVPTPPSSAKPAESPAPVPDDAKPDDAKPDDAKPDDAKPDDAKPDDAEPADSDSSELNRDRNSSPVRLVAYQQDEDMPPVVADPPAPDTDAPQQSADVKPTEAKPTDVTPTEVKPAEVKPTEVDPTGVKLNEAESAEAEKTEAAEAEGKPAEGKPTSGAPVGDGPAGAAATPPPTPAEPAMRTQTFEEAKDSVAKSLAMNVVREKLQTKMSKLETAMKAYSDAIAIERIKAESGQKSDKKTPLIDLKKLAEAEGLSYGSTGMSDGFRLAATPIGRSMIGNQSLANAILNPSVELYQPVRSMFIDMENAVDPDFQEFLSWKTEAEQAYTPALTDIRDEVIEAWKLQRARVLAKEAAQKLADQVKKSGDEGWKGVLDAQQQTLVISPPPFAWMSAPREMFPHAQVTFVQGLDTVGPEFMQRVFSASTNETIVAPNQGMTTYYVTRLIELSPTLDQLHQNFEASRGRARQLAFSEREQLFSKWYQGIERSLNVQWVGNNEALTN